jgi:hypothetical protein
MWKLKNNPQLFNLTTGSNPSKKSRNDDILFDRPVTHTTPECYEEPRAFRAPRPKRYVFRLVPAEPHQCVTTHTGQKLFIRLKTEESLKQTVYYRVLTTQFQFIINPSVFV